MMSSRKANVAAVVGSAMLVGSAALGVASTQAGAAAPVADAHGQSEAVATNGSETVRTEGVSRIANVQGDFSYTQDAVTPTSTIAGTFVKAVSSLCASLTDYDMSQLDQRIAVYGSDGARIDATISEMGQADGADTSVMACSCASNGAGGGAIANAEVSGVSFETVARLAGERE